MQKLSSVHEKLRARAAAVRNATDPAGASIVQIAIDDIERDEKQPRQHFDQAKLEELAASIRRRGLLQPITVRPKNEGGKHPIKMGERRWRAARLAGLGTVPCIIRAGDDHDSTDQMIENVQREALTAEEWARYIEQQRSLGLKDTEIADQVGVSKATVSIYAAVLKLPAEIRAHAHVMGPRELYELHGLWLEDRDGALALLREHAPEEITRAMIKDARRGAGAAEAPIAAAPPPGEIHHRLATVPAEPVDVPATGSPTPAGRSDRPAPSPAPAPARGPVAAPIDDDPEPEVLARGAGLEALLTTANGGMRDLAAELRAEREATDDHVAMARDGLREIAAHVVPVALAQVAASIDINRIEDLVSQAVTAAAAKDVTQYGVVMRHLAALALAHAAAAAMPTATLLMGDQ